MDSNTPPIGPRGMVLVASHSAIGGAEAAPDVKSDWIHLCEYLRWEAHYLDGYLFLVQAMTAYCVGVSTPWRKPWVLLYVCPG